jgi:hypothetical protein
MIRNSEVHCSARREHGQRWQNSRHNTKNNKPMSPGSTVRGTEVKKNHLAL